MRAPSAPPLAERLRPRSLDDVLGQRRWLGPGAPLRRAFETGRFHSLVLWGPPGCGKTTLARLVADASDAVFVSLSAVLSGVKDLRGALERAAAARRLEGRGTVLFVDEIHRWNRAQQDALLPHLEDGSIVLIGATTENPSFALTAALRSRLEIVRLDPLDAEAIRRLLVRALTDPAGLGPRNLTATEDALTRLARAAAGDARRALSDLERIAAALPDGGRIDAEVLAAVPAREDLRHDRAGDDHHDVVSAFIKSLRGSDPDASLYWLARLIAAGEDPRFIARRLIVFAAEDVGNADPRALSVAVDAARAVQFIGMPEGRIVLAQATTWLACSPKSNAAYRGIDAALAAVKRTGALPVPLHLRNAATPTMRDEGFGSGYRYPHDHPHHVVRQQYLPDALCGERFYDPADHAEERRIRQRLAWWAHKLAERDRDGGPPEDR